MRQSFWWRFHVCSLPCGLLHGNARKLLASFLLCRYDLRFQFPNFLQLYWPNETALCIFLWVCCTMVVLPLGGWKWACVCVGICVHWCRVMRAQTVCRDIRAFATCIPKYCVTFTCNVMSRVAKLLPDIYWATLTCAFKILRVVLCKSCNTFPNYYTWHSLTGISKVLQDVLVSCIPVWSFEFSLSLAFYGFKRWCRTCIFLSGVTAASKQPQMDHAK